jgi:hypothetical protein
VYDLAPWLSIIIDTAQSIFQLSNAPFLEDNIWGSSGGSLVVTPDYEHAVSGLNLAISPAYSELPVLRWAAIWNLSFEGQQRRIKTKRISSRPKTIKEHLNLTNPTMGELCCQRFLRTNHKNWSRLTNLTFSLSLTLQSRLWIWVSRRIRSYLRKQLWVWNFGPGED